MLKYLRFDFLKSNALFQNQKRPWKSTSINQIQMPTD